MPPEPVTTPAGLPRRLGALFYDSLLLLAVLFFATLPVLVLRQGTAVQPGNIAYTAYLIVVIFLFFAHFWTRGGQTLGMRAWKIRTVQHDGRPLTWGKALLRYLCAWVALLPGGIGLWWIIFDKDRLAWHDRWSGTRVVSTTTARG